MTDVGIGVGIGTGVTVVDSGRSRKRNIIGDIGWLGLGKVLVVVVVGAAESFKGAPFDGPVVAGADAAPFDGNQGC